MNPADPTPLERLARHAGLQTDWRDAWGQPRSLAPDALRAVLTAMDLPCGTPGECESSRARLAADDAAHPLPPLTTADQGQPVKVPCVDAQAQRPYRLELEDGSSVEGIAHRIERSVDNSGDQGDLGSDRSGVGMMEIPPIGTWGYHRLLLGDLETTVAVAPPRCYGVADALAASPRAAHAYKPWGLSVQLYSLRRGAPTGLGDLTTLALCCEAAAREHADAVAINPLHAGFAALPARYSPYAPSSRLFHSPLYADPAALFGQDAVDQGIAALRLGHTLAAAEARAEIDWPALSRARYALLRWLWDRHETLLPTDALRAFSAFRARGGNALLAHACFEAIQAERLDAAQGAAQGGAHAHSQASKSSGKQAEAATDWRRWPVSLHAPNGAAVTAFATMHPDEIGYHTFLQWLAATGLGDAQRRAREAGMAIGVIADLAVGTDPGGSHAWTRQAEILDGFHAGAPPDLYNPLGQDWGVAVFSPRGLRRHGYAAFIEMLRANLAHAGGLRIDHVLGLARMWLVPAGAPASAGAYLTYPLDDLLRLVALESWRHHAIIIGENLGTVPESLNAALAARGVLGIDVLWFERMATDEPAPDDTEAPSAAGPVTAPFLPPERWPAQAVATTTTHDLPTIVGWWAGNDIAWRARLHHLGENETEDSLMALRAVERAALWQAMCDAGLASGAAPGPTMAPVEIILRWLGRAGTPLRLVPVEDLLGAAEQPNLPGTVTDHPNWLRRLDTDVREIFAQAEVRARVEAVRDDKAC
ncbi:4-alpha-glucanotransferase [Cupriavidus sp. RAF12]|uniref:4-alpha-glucanotransferase n=1 Tax=Cupriavidus sp. RAF12 TaxID=3233050 RepID=UPI003F8F4976